MPDTTTVVEAPVAPKKRKQNRALLNQAQVEELTKAEQIARCAQKATYAPALAAREVDDAFVTLLLSDIASCRDKSSDAMQNTTGKESATVDESNTEGDLVAAIQEVQAAAKQKYARSNPVILQDYFIGKKITVSRDDLEQYSLGIVNKLATDTLPGITPAKVVALQTARQAWIDANASQTTLQSDATSARAERDAMIASIRDRRIQVQFAADAEWPWTKEENAGIRREFYLPLSRPFNG